MPDFPIRLIQAGVLEPGLTQALYHSLAERMDASAPDTIVLCQPATPYLCLGYHQVLDAVLDVPVCQTLNLPIFRRRVGGGATYLDTNQVFYQCIFHHSRVPARTDRIYERMLAAPVKLLQRLGLQGRLRAINEVEAEGLRVAGIGGGRIGEAMVVVGNLLLDFDYETMGRVWRVPHPAFRKLAVAALHERVTTLRRLGCHSPSATLQDGLADTFRESMERPVESGMLSEAEWEHARQNATLLASPDFLQQHRPEGTIPPMRSLKIAAEVFIHAKTILHQGRSLEYAVRAEQGTITAVQFQEDTSPGLDDLRTQMLGTSVTDWD